MHPRPESCSCPGVLPQHNRPPTQRPSALCIPSPASSQDEPTWGVLYAWALGRVMKHPISPSRAVRVRGDGTGLARRKRAGMRAGSQLAGGGSRQASSRTAASFGCAASATSTYPSEFRTKFRAPSFWVSQARASWSKLQGFVFCSAAVYYIARHRHSSARTARAARRLWC